MIVNNKDLSTQPVIPTHIEVPSCGNKTLRI
jgi:hypothetical protein